MKELKKQEKRQKVNQLNNRKIIANELFYCEHLFERHDILSELRNNFYVSQKSDKGLEIYLKNYSKIDETNNENRTYIVRDVETDEIAAYFSLKAGLFSIGESTDVTEDEKVPQFETLPGVELAEFAVNQKYILDHPENKGCGSLIMNGLIIPIVKNVQRNIGVKVLYIFALPEEKLINRYIEKYKFCRLNKIDEDNLHSRIKPRFDYGCIFMYHLI